MNDDEFSRIKRRHGERASRPILYAFGFYAITSIWMLILVMERGVHLLYMVALVSACTGMGLLLIAAMGCVQEEMDTAGTKLLIAHILQKQKQARIIGWIPRGCANCPRYVPEERAGLFEAWER